ncbi:MAG: hypothetical protein NZ777_17185, partial [Pseudomonadales bacterium]|nr:hypothetical protein [Pseudomonadales bacterium]
MNSAQFLAEMESNIRGAITETSPYKNGSHGVRAWGGLNVLQFGDSYQLDCPEGTPLYQIPSKLVPGDVMKVESGTASRGLDLMWDYAEHECVQGLTELTRRFRCGDEWWNEVLDEIRTLQLSSDNHAFLHGLPTSVPGSWLNGRAACQDPRCQRLCGASWETILAQECHQICQAERATRRRVLPEEARHALQADDLEYTPAAVPNNDLRYEINKLRSELYAAKHKKQILWCPAKDQATTDALREDASLAYKKKEWLQRHDRQCGDLQSMLPLVQGMPMILGNHLDRSPDRRMLKGTRVLLHSVQLREEDERAAKGKAVHILQHLPICVYVQKENADWTVGACKEKGVYPVRISHAKWFLDAGRPHPVLGIMRYQVPLSPGFALTVHSVQGKEEDPLIVDVCLSARTSRQTCYVALSRGKTRRGIYILRPFSMETFQGCSPLGPQLLLRRLRREEIDWEKVTQEVTERNAATKTMKKEKGGHLECFGCDALLPWQLFSGSQRSKGAERCCHDCVLKEGRPKKEEKKCAGACQRVLARANYSETQWDKLEGQAVCTECTKGYSQNNKIELKKCAGACQRVLPRATYSVTQWSRLEGHAVCTE